MRSRRWITGVCAVQVALTWGLLRWATPTAIAETVVTHEVAELNTLLDSRATPEALAELLRWMLRNNDSFTLELSPTDPSANVYSHPILERLHQNARALSWGGADRFLSTEERYQIYCAQTPKGLRYGPIDFFPTSNLFTDDMLLYAITYLVENPLSARYDGVRSRTTYSDPLLAKAPEFIWRFLRENPTGFSRVLTALKKQPLYDGLMTDTFDEHHRSQVEPFDHLCVRLQLELREALGQLEREPFVNRAALNRFCRQYTDLVFGYPEKRNQAPPVAFGHNGDAETRTFDFLCAGRLDAIQFGEPLPNPPGIRWIKGINQTGPTNSRFVERLLHLPVSGFHITYGVFDLRPDLDKEDVELYLRCATGVYALSFDVERGEGVLPEISNRMRLDHAKEMGELNVVSSFALFPSPSDKRFGLAMIHLAQIGFFPVGKPTTVPNLWDDFLMEVTRPNTSLVVPIYHVVDQERFRLGWNNSRKLIFRKTFAEKHEPGTIRTVRMAIYAPPSDPDAEEVVLHRSEFGKLFRTRVVSPAKEDTLCLMNMSCFSQYTVESWMAAYRESIRDRNPAEIDPEEIPFIIGSKQGFDADAPFLWLEFPELMMRGLCAEKSRSEMQADLTESGAGHYEPMTNMNRPELLEMGGSFRLHVSNPGDPLETVSF